MMMEQGQSETIRTLQFVIELRHEVLVIIKSCFLIYFGLALQGRDL